MCSRTLVDESKRVGADQHAGDEISDTGAGPGSAHRRVARMPANGRMTTGADE